MKWYNITAVDWAIMVGLSFGFFFSAIHFENSTFVWFAMVPVALMLVLLLLERVLYPRLFLWKFCPDCRANVVLVELLGYALVLHKVLVELQKQDAESPSLRQCRCDLTRFLNDLSKDPSFVDETGVFKEILEGKKDE